jgi:hypothetical protein
VDDARLVISQFQQVYGEIEQRLGLPVQGSDYYELMWDTFRTAERAHMVTATADRAKVGAILHVRCGDELLSFAGGQTADGGRA